jgi:hypothetical protein
MAVEAIKKFERPHQAWNAINGRTTLAQNYSLQKNNMEKKLVRRATF